MLVRRISGQKVATIPSFDEKLPDRGILCVTGQNGKGKTLRFIESVAWAVWGKTLRGTPLGPDASVSLTTDTHQVARSVRGRKLVWSRLDGNDASHATPSKGTDALEQELGSYESWLRSHVFSSADGSLFSTAGDADRKRFLERLMGLDQFDKALAWVKPEFDTINEHLAYARAEEVRLVGHITSLKSTIVDLYELVEQSQSKVDLEAAHFQIIQLSARRQARSLDYQRLNQEVGAAKGELNAVMRRQLQHNDGRCYACDQPVPIELLRSQQKAAESAQTRLQFLERETLDELQAAHREIHALDHEILQVSKTIPQNVVALVGVKEKIESFREQGREAVASLNNVRADLSLLQNRLRVVEHAKVVLGVRGYRARLLGRALASVTDLANTYLSWISDDMRIELLDHTLKASGTTQHTIALNVEGRGGGHGYYALSAGERRRVDLVLLVALANLSGSRGTLFFDEAFDALDESGVEAAAGLLKHIAETRPVVVITHSRGLQKHLGVTPRQL